MVSVIVPVYERRACVMDAVASVLDQTHRHVECIVVDDGSTDGGFDAVVSACRGEPRVKVSAQAHGGVSAARNRGLREAGGPYVTFLDSDDLMPPGRVRRQLELLDEWSCDGVFGKGEAVAMPGVTPPVWFPLRPEWVHGHVWMTLLVRAESLRAVGGFDEALRIGEDADLLVRLRGAGVDVRATDETFVARRFFGDNLTYAIDEHHSALGDALRRRSAHRRADVTQ